MVAKLRQRKEMCLEQHVPSENKRALKEGMTKNFDSNIGNNKCLRYKASLCIHD